MPGQVMGRLPSRQLSRRMDALAASLPWLAYRLGNPAANHAKAAVSKFYSTSVSCKHCVQVHQLEKLSSTIPKYAKVLSCVSNSPLYSKTLFGDCSAKRHFHSSQKSYRRGGKDKSKEEQLSEAKKRLEEEIKKLEEEMRKIAQEWGKVGSKDSNEAKKDAESKTKDGKENLNDSKSQENKSGDGQEEKRKHTRESPEEKEERIRTEMMQNLWTLGALFLLIILLARTGGAADDARMYISWNDFYNHLLMKGEVKNIVLRITSGEEDFAEVTVHDGATVKGKDSVFNKYYLKIPKNFQFEEKVRKVEDDLDMDSRDRVPIKYIRSDVPGLGSLLFLVLLGLLARRAFMSAFPKSGGPGGAAGGSSSFIDSMTGGIRKAKYTRADANNKGPAVTFKDVAGLKEAKVEVMEFISYLTKPEVYKALGAKTPRGALLLGPPGCGKTLLARALATEAQVPFFAMAGSEFVEVIGGVGASRVRDLFAEARQKAPCIIYIDEIDAIGKKRSSGAQMGGGEDENTLNQLLVEMDGMADREGVIMLAATNRADILDKALLRPGRFDRHILIDHPTMEERQEILQVYLNKLKLAQPASVYAGPLARLTPGFSGADIANLCNEAAIHAARDQRPHVDKKDFDFAVERVVAGAEKKTRLLSPVEKEVVAYHEAGHALVGWLLEHCDTLLRVSIVPRTSAALGFAQYLPSDQKLYSKQELFERMCMALGGRAAETIIFNKATTGAQDDLKRVTQMAYEQIRNYGMSDSIGHLSFPGPEEDPMAPRPYSTKLQTAMDTEVRQMVAQAHMEATRILEENKDQLHVLAKALLTREVLETADVERLLGPPKGEKKQKNAAPSWQGLTG